MEVKSTLYPCAHCERTGTCSRASNGVSCAFCVKEIGLKGSGHVGIPCSICMGIGHAETKTERVRHRIGPVLALITVYVLLIAVLISAVAQSKYFSEMVSFAGPLIGMVLTFYFTRTSPKA